MRRVLDSWALLAWLQGEQPAARKVRKLLAAAAGGELELTMSMLNVGEVFYLVAKRHGLPEAEAFLAALKSMPIRTVMPSASGVIDAARLKSQFAISYADSFALQTAIQEGAPLVSGDRELRPVANAGIVDLVWIG